MFLCQAWKQNCNLQQTVSLLNIPEGYKHKTLAGEAGLLVFLLCLLRAAWSVRQVTCWCGVQAFAWFSDLLVEHAEIFWSLFGVDMNVVLDTQPPDTWDSFPLFQLLNDYLRTDGESGISPWWSDGQLVIDGEWGTDGVSVTCVESAMHDLMSQGLTVCKWLVWRW